MNNVEKLQKYCTMFRDFEMGIWPDGDCVKMKIPYFLNDGVELTIRTRFVYKNGESMICISDDGCVARHCKVTLPEICMLCEQYDLECSIWDKKAVPPDCEIYKIVDIGEFHITIWHIMELALEARYFQRTYLR